MATSSGLGAILGTQDMFVNIIKILPFQRLNSIGWKQKDKELSNNNAKEEKVKMGNECEMVRVSGEILVMVARDGLSKEVGFE